jgi:hypothetical protein
LLFAALNASYHHCRVVCVLPHHSAAGQASSSSAAAAGGASSSNALSQQQQQPLPLSWSELPADVKQAILGHLPLRDLARAAPTCSEFCMRARHMRRHVQRLLLPSGLGYSGLVGMVAGHACAGLVDLSRLERHIARLNAEELPPQVGCFCCCDVYAKCF